LFDDSRKILETIQVVLSEALVLTNEMTEGRHLQPLEGISSHMLGKIQGTKREVTGAGDVKKGVTSPSWNQHCSEVQSRHGTAQKQQAVNRCQRTRHFGP